jgi:AcrR family transcriptional regulator
LSRTTNPVLTEHIVTAARRLWHKQGEKGLTLRAVARAAGTTTPSVYQRFPAKQDLTIAIANQIRLEIGAAVAGSGTIEKGLARYLQYAKSHKHEYGILNSTAFGQIFGKIKPRPGFEWAQQELVRQHGGKAEDYEATVMAVTCLLHGTASLLLYMPPGALADEVEESCRRAALLLADHPLREGKRKPKKR